MPVLSRKSRSNSASASALGIRSSFCPPMVVPTRPLWQEEERRSSGPRHGPRCGVLVGSAPLAEDQVLGLAGKRLRPLFVDELEHVVGVGVARHVGEAHRLGVDAALLLQHHAAVLQPRRLVHRAEPRHLDRHGARLRLIHGRLQRRLARQARRRAAAAAAAAAASRATAAFAGGAQRRAEELGARLALELGVVLGEPRDREQLGRDHPRLARRALRAEDVGRVELAGEAGVEAVIGAEGGSTQLACVR